MLRQPAFGLEIRRHKIHHICPVKGLEFFKYQGAGNDFILIDDRAGLFPESEKLVSQLCDRKFGIGSDGILLIKNSEQADVHLDFLNPDSTRSFCGNGSRCGLRFAEELGLVEGSCTFEAIDGLHEAALHKVYVRISMSDVSEIIDHNKGYMLDTGSPHLVIEVDDLENHQVADSGAQLRYSPEFAKHGINVNFVEFRKDNKLSIRTYERGVEAETLSCGTGVTAAALALAYKQKLHQGRIEVSSRGGELAVEFNYDGNSFHDIWLEGPAKKVFGGEILI